MTTPQAIAEVAGARAFGSRLITNVFRGLVVEAIVASALCPDWHWCSQDYYGFDFKHTCGKRLEVKQSAACQSWPSSKPSLARWDIASRQGFYEGEKFTAAPGRNADIYILGWHPEKDRKKADHRDPRQWEFFIVASANLSSGAKTIGLTTLRTIEGMTVSRADELQAKVAAFL